MASIRFNSRTPGGVRHLGRWHHPSTPLRFNSRTPGGVRPLVRLVDEVGNLVSIHAPREGCDGGPLTTMLPTTSFNSRTPGGVRPTYTDYNGGGTMFQFTHPGRGATVIIIISKCYYGVSIHAPREGCDLFVEEANRGYKAFQFTHPGRGATYWYKGVNDVLRGFNSRTPGGVRLISAVPMHWQEGVSIHAPREGCDSWTSTSSSTIRSFNSRTPGGVRRTSVFFVNWVEAEFQFTHPGRGATVQLPRLMKGWGVSIHAPREGCDCKLKSPPL